MDKQNLDLKIKLHLELQGQSSLKIMGIFTKVVCICGPNFRILASTGHQLWRRNKKVDEETDEQTDAGNDNTGRSKLALGKNQGKF